MKNRYYGVLSTKLEDGTIEKTVLKSKKNKGKAGFLDKFGEVIKAYYEMPSYVHIMARLEENPLTYTGDFAEEINHNIQTIRAKVLKLKREKEEAEKAEI